MKVRRPEAKTSITRREVLEAELRTCDDRIADARRVIDYFAKRKRAIIAKLPQRK